MSEPILPEELALEVASSNFKDERLNARLAKHCRPFGG
jgi:hypothetical protein